MVATCFSDSYEDIIRLYWSLRTEHIPIHIYVKVRTEVSISLSY